MSVKSLAHQVERVLNIIFFNEIAVQNIVYSSDSAKLLRKITHVLKLLFFFIFKKGAIPFTKQNYFALKSRKHCRATLLWNLY